MIKVHHHLIALWLVVIALGGLRVFEFYEGNNDTQKINYVLRKLAKGQKKILEYIKYNETYDDD